MTWIQYREGDASTADIVGTAIMFETSGVMGNLSDVNPLPVSGSFSVTGGATSAKQSDGSQKTQVVDGSGNVIGSTSNALDVNIKSGASSGTQYADGAARGTATGTLAMGDDGTNIQSIKVDSSWELQVDILSSALPSGASTETTLAALNTKVTACNTGAVVISSALPAGTNAIGKLSANSGVDIGDVDVTTVGTITPGTAASNLGKAEDAVHASGDVGVFSLWVANETQTTLAANGDYIGEARDTKWNAMTVGNIANDGVDAGNPVKFGGVATITEQAAVSASGDRVNAAFTSTGKQIVAPFSSPEYFVSGAITTAMTATTSTSLVAAPGASLRNYITTIVVSNSHATVGTDVVIQDGSGGTTLMTIPAAALYGGAVINLPVPLRQPTTNTAIFCANVTTGASTKVSAVGYKGI